MVRLAGIGYTFGCTVSYPTFAGPTGTDENQIQFRMQTPQHGRWWVVALDNGKPGKAGEVALTFVPRGDLTAESVTLRAGSNPSNSHSSV
jgi:hypothetical protein